MPGSFDNALENAILDHIFGGGDFTRDATLYARLMTTDPTDAAAGTQVSTGVWTNYAPVAITNNATNFPAASGGAKANGTKIDFGTAAITGGPPVILGVELWTASSGGTRRAWAELTVDKTINNGDPVSIEIGDLDITLD